jgi:hypothetical protein
MVFFTSFVMFTRAKTGVYLPGVDRYKYFPFMGFAVALAPALVYLRGRVKGAAVALAAVLLVISAVHHRKIERSFYTDFSAKTFVKMAGEKLREGGTRYIENLGTVKVGHIKNLDYISFLHLVKATDDRLSIFRGRLLLLKDYEEIAPERWLPVDNKEGLALKGGTIEIKADEKISLLLKGANSGPFGHLSFSMKSDAPFEGSILRYGEDGGTKRTAFDVPGGFWSREYLLACPGGRNLLLIVGPGNIRIKDVRLYR